MSGSFAELLPELPELLGGHLRLTLLALAVGLSLSLPLGVLATRLPRLERVVMGLASVIQTIPGLALLAVMVPLLALVSLPSIGMLPALIGLSAYSVLPILRNTVTGIRGVDPAYIEAARGVGMSERERLRLVELPLALPVIVAGVRTASVWVVGTATLSTPVGAPSLGNYIFSGLQTRNDAAVVLGCVGAALLALSLDGLIRAFEWALVERRVGLRRGLLGLFALAYVWVFALPLLDARRGPAPEASVVIGTKPFTEQYILGELLVAQLDSHTELEPSVLPSLGSKVAFDALVAGEVDVYVEYTGTLWTNVMGRETADSREQVLRELEDWLAREHDVELVAALGFENAYALAVPAARAEQLGLERIDQLTPHAPGWSIAGDYEFFSRPEWQALRDRYGLRFDQTRAMDSALMYEALQSGEAEVLSAYSSDGRVAAYELRILADPRAAIPPYDAVVLVNGEAARTKVGLREALAALEGRVSVERMRSANMAVDLEGQTPAQVGAQLHRELEKN